MLKKAVEKESRDWDCLLPYLLFSIRIDHFETSPSRSCDTHITRPRPLRPLFSGNYYAHTISPPHYIRRSLVLRSPACTCGGHRVLPPLIRLTAHTSLLAHSSGDSAWFHIYWGEAIKETEEKIVTIETQLTSTLTSSEFNTLKNKVDSILSSHQKTLEERKRTKFQRDTEDYLNNKVYRWDETTHRRPYPRSRHPAGKFAVSGDSSPAGGSSPGSGSDVGGTSTKAAFLGQSGRLPGGREGKDRERQMTLRSQANPKRT
ncbi:uncharacterized protein [Ranitomeya imitator]|uniref:uncharacterized protein n=1 Tax=Ranitomeya imitator TaxID=111125 RepID=UPI0037E8C3E7